MGKMKRIKKGAVSGQKRRINCAHGAQRRWSGHHWAGKDIFRTETRLGRGVKMGKHVLGIATVPLCV